MRTLRRLPAGALLLLAPLAVLAADLRQEARETLDRAIAYYHSRVAVHGGGYVYFYSLDLEQRWGEGLATKDQAFTQPPGTPAVGDAYLRAYAATRDPRHLVAARDAGRALAHGQLKSGGWAQAFDWNPSGTKAGLYRNGKGNPKGRNHTSLDDDQTQACIAFLARLDRALDFKDPLISESVRYALDALLGAQFPNGAFPQGFTAPVASHPILPASYPAEWPRSWPNEPYWNYYTLNDGLAGSVSEMLLAVIDVYQDPRYLAALRRLGDFLILAQMPPPQPAWCQQYSYTMQPTWARRFEPPAICGLESEDAIRTLLRIHRQTGEKKYLEPIPRALAYLTKLRLPDGLMPRYFELQTDKPLYMNRNGQTYFLTYDDKNLPSHYGWKQKTSVEALEREYVSAAAGDTGRGAQDNPTADLENKVRSVIAALDAEGRWISTYAGERLVGQPKFAQGFRYIDSGVFIRNVELLSEYLTR